MFPTSPSPHLTEKRRPYNPPALTELTPEAVTAALESSSKDNDKLAEALRELASVARRPSEVPKS
jgi:hypothetical protein